MKIDRFEDLEVWQLAREICHDVENLFEATPLGRDMLYEIKWTKVQDQ